jgi:hypothetical protein
MGLQADARVVMVFAEPPRQFYRDVTNPAHLSGPRHLDRFIVTPNLHPSIGTLQKRMPTLTRAATQLNRRAVMCKVSLQQHDYQPTNKILANNKLVLYDNLDFYITMIL